MRTSHRSLTSKTTTSSSSTRSKAATSWTSSISSSYNNRGGDVPSSPYLIDDTMSGLGSAGGGGGGGGNSSLGAGPYHHSSSITSAGPYSATTISSSSSSSDNNKSSLPLDDIVMFHSNHGGNNNNNNNTGTRLMDDAEIRQSSNSGGGGLHPLSLESHHNNNNNNNNAFYPARPSLGGVGTTDSLLNFSSGNTKRQQQQLRSDDYEYERHDRKQTISMKRKLWCYAILIVGVIAMMGAGVCVLLIFTVGRHPNNAPPSSIIGDNNNNNNADDDDDGEGADDKRVFLLECDQDPFLRLTQEEFSRYFGEYTRIKTEIAQARPEQVPDPLSCTDDMNRALWYTTLKYLKDAGTISYDDGSEMGSTESAKAQVQRYVMAHLYYSMDGPNWSDPSFNSTWLPETKGNDNNNNNDDNDDGPCSWQGIRCSSSTTTTNAANDDDTGKTPSLVELAMNIVEGARGTIPTTLGLLSNELQLVNLGTNAFVGTIPSELATLYHLQLVNFRQNRLTGTLPWQLQDWPSSTLLLVDFSDNRRLRGSINPIVDAWPNVGRLNLADTQLTGTIPPIFCTQNVGTTYTMPCGITGCECCIYPQDDCPSSSSGGGGGGG